MCQVCDQLHGTQKEAEYWCGSCSKISEIQFYCDSCFTSEHSSLSIRSHVRSPVEKVEASFPICAKHKLPEDSYCFDEKVFICNHCLCDNHKTHNTKLAYSHGREVKAQFSTSVEKLSLTSTRICQTSQNTLETSKQEKSTQIGKLKEKIQKLENEVQMIDSSLSKITQTSEKSKTGTLALSKAIQEFPIRDVFDDKKKLN